MFKLFHRVVQKEMADGTFRPRDHTDAFWNEVDKVMPDFRERKEWLRKNGAGLDI